MLDVLRNCSHACVVFWRPFFGRTFPASSRRRRTPSTRSRSTSTRRPRRPRTGSLAPQGCPMPPASPKGAVPCRALPRSDVCHARCMLACFTFNRVGAVVAGELGVCLVPPRGDDYLPWVSVRCTSVAADAGRAGGAPRTHAVDIFYSRLLWLSFLPPPPPPLASLDQGNARERLPDDTGH